jgi:hypothetical protein
MDPNRNFGDLLDEFVIDDIQLASDAECSIFIVEDSMVDLGLIVSVERYWERFMNIITDYLEWNLSVEPEMVVEPTVNFVPVFPEREARDSRGWFKRLLDKVTLRERRQRKRTQEEMQTLPSAPGSSLVQGEVGQETVVIEQAEVLDVIAAGEIQIDWEVAEGRSVESETPPSETDNVNADPEGEEKVDEQK